MANANTAKARTKVCASRGWEGRAAGLANWHFKWESLFRSKPSLPIKRLIRTCSPEPEFESDLKQPWLGLGNRIAYDVKSARKKWGASPHFCINNGLIIHPQMFSLLKLSLDTLDMYVCFIFYASSRLLKSNSHGKWQENEDFKGNLVDIFFYFLRSKL